MLFIISSSDNSKEWCSFLDLFHKDKLVSEAQEEENSVSRHQISSAYPMDEFELSQGNEQEDLHALLFSSYRNCESILICVL